MPTDESQSSSKTTNAKMWIPIIVAIITALGPIIVEIIKSL